MYLVDFQVYIWWFLFNTIYEIIFSLQWASSLSVFYLIIKLKDSRNTWLAITEFNTQIQMFLMIPEGS